MTFEGPFSLCCHSHVQYLGNYMRYVYSKLKLLIRNHTTAFRWYYFDDPSDISRSLDCLHQISRKRCAKRQKLPWTNRKSFTSFRLVSLLMTLKDIWRSFQSRLSFPRPISQKLHKICPQLMKLFITNHTRAFLWYAQYTADDLGDISRSLDCFSSNFS